MGSTTATGTQSFSFDVQVCLSALCDVLPPSATDITLRLICIRAGTGLLTPACHRGVLQRNALMRRLSAHMRLAWPLRCWAGCRACPQGNAIHANMGA